MEKQYIEDLFSYHQGKDVDPKRFEELRECAKKMAYCIEKNGCGFTDKELAIRKLRECLFFAIASIVVPRH